MRNYSRPVASIQNAQEKKDAEETDFLAIFSQFIFSPLPPRNLPPPPYTISKEKPLSAFSAF